MSDRSNLSRSIRYVFVVATIALVLEPAFLLTAALAEDPAPAPPSTPTITAVRCEGLKVHVQWKGSGVGVVDYYGAGVPVLQLRQDPTPAQSSTDITLGKEWEGRKIDVRIWDKDVKLLDTKPVECKTAS